MGGSRFFGFWVWGLGLSPGVECRAAVSVGFVVVSPYWGFSSWFFPEYPGVRLYGCWERACLLSPPCWVSPGGSSPGFQCTAAVSNECDLVNLY